MIQYVDFETARGARGVRLVTSGLVPSPWSEAAKGLFRLAGIPVLATRPVRGDAAFAAWTQAHNVPVVFHDDEPPRTVWSQIVALAARLAGPGVLLPVDIDARIATIGTIHELAGEYGVGWNARLVMIDLGLATAGRRGFAPPIAAYLAPKYGHQPGLVAGARDQVGTALARLAARLAGRPYFGGDRPDALDVYAATFLTPVSPITEAECPKFAPALRAAFGSAHEELGALVPAALSEHRRRMYDHHLGWPIEL